MNLALVLGGSSRCGTVFDRQGAQNAHGNMGLFVHVQPSTTLATVLIDALVAESQFPVLSPGLAALGTDLAKAQSLGKTATADDVFIGAGR